MPRPSLRPRILRPYRRLGASVFASPLARRIAAEKGLDLSQIKGSGPHGRIVKADVEGAKTAEQPVTAQGGVPPPVTAPPAPAGTVPQGATAETVAKLFADRAYDVVLLDGMRKTIAARLTEAKQTIPHFYLRRSVNLDPLLAFRETLNKQLEGRGIKLSVNDFIIKACALALQKVPDANAVWAGDRIFRLKPSDVAVAVAIDGRPVHAGAAGRASEVALVALGRNERSCGARTDPQARAA